MDKPIIDTILKGKVKRVGDPNATKPMEKQWESGMFKKEVNGSIWLGKTGLQGDEVADKKNHGGPEKAVFTYPIRHYDYWRKDLELETIGIGAHGENFAVHHMDESNVCIGDSYQVGEAIIQVSQPRQPCWKPARRFGVMDFALRIQKSGRTGWYFRVLKEGNVTAGDTIELMERPYPQWTIDACNDVMHVQKDNLRLAGDLASCELLAENWKNTLNKRIRGKQSNIEKRVFGPNKE
ncbi:MOSC domain-containing protein [Ornithinibacillus halophilus]|uniref:MOSC domain-containing protein YiiM n=1 Tax=Ornithinibacillus halophilus TaxID=930117 RepID=A0A1M5ES98_9BACI|nr:MOSC domain-containing protein [Ornithinibacillus halophilus]SHF81991.1 MOSC domain-containing protein YiiM [Ornithinibacillus halophilus]